jgi:hypothetical protein
MLPPSLAVPLVLEQVLLVRRPRRLVQEQLGLARRRHLQL